MTCTPSLAARSARPSPTRRLRSSDSTTQGPAMRNGAEPKCWVIASLVQAGEPGPAPNLRPGAHVAVLASRADEAGEQRVRPRGARLELGVELAADEPGVVGELDHFHERAVGRQPRAPHPVLGQHVAVGVRYLVAVAVALAHLRGAVHMRDARAGAQLAGVGAEPHSPAHLLDAFLRAHQRDHRVLAFGLELARVGVGELADVARELDDRRLQAEADAQERQLVLAGPADRFQHSLHAAHPEPTRYEERVV